MLPPKKLAISRFQGWCGTSGSFPGQYLELAGPADDLRAVHVAVLLRQKAPAGALEDCRKVLQLDLGRIRGGDEVIERGLDVVEIDGGVVLERALHPRADQAGLDVCARERAGPLEEKLLRLGRVDPGPRLLL